VKSSLFVALRERFKQATKTSEVKVRRGLYIERELKYKIFFIFRNFFVATLEKKQ